MEMVEKKLPDLCKMFANHSQGQNRKFGHQEGNGHRKACTEETSSNPRENLNKCEEARGVGQCKY